MTPSRRRRSNGEGTVYLRAYGRWVGSAYFPVPGGRRKRKDVYGRTQAEALAKLKALQADVSAGLVLPARDWRLGDYLDYWLRHVVRPERRPKTYQGYELAARLHIVPTLGRRRLSQLRVSDVRQFIGTLQDKGLGVRMVQFVHAVLRNALQNAVREELVARNVASLVRVRTPVYEVGRGLSVAQARDLLRESRESRLHALIVFALYLGLRRGELLGLRWADVDMEQGRLEITQTLQRIGGQLRLLPPKTRHSRRTYPLPEPCVVALRAHRAAQNVERLAAGADWVDSGMVFTTTLGTPVNPDNFSRAWAKLRAVLGDPPVRFHDLRHTCVTLLLDSGVPPHVVRDVVGHSALDVTMDIYAHVSLDEKRTALSKLADRLA